MGGEIQHRSWATLNPNGILVSLLQPPSQEMAAAVGARGEMVGTPPAIGKVLTQVAQMIDDGHIHPYVSAVLPLSEIRKAHEMVETKHTRGKIVLKVI